MYLRINKDEDKDKVLQYLHDNNIDFNQFDDALKVFLDEEAEERISHYLITTMNGVNLGEREVDELIDKYREEVARGLFDNNYILNDDTLNDVTENILERSGPYANIEEWHNKELFNQK